jgi:ankyrin repeat protein
MAAAGSRKWDIVNHLLWKGANVKRLTAVVSSKILIGRDYLIYETNSNSNPQSKKNALHYAAQQGAPDDIVKTLIEAGADSKAKDKDGKTPVDFAYDNNYPSTASYINKLSTPLTPLRQ